MTSNVLQFRARAVAPRDEVEDVDLLTAVDVVIRELRDISHGSVAVCPEKIADCASLLERAYRKSFI